MSIPKELEEMENTKLVELLENAFNDRSTGRIYPRELCGVAAVRIRELILYQDIFRLMSMSMDPNKMLDNPLTLLRMASTEIMKAYALYQKNDKDDLILREKCALAIQLIEKAMSHIHAEQP